MAVTNEWEVMEKLSKLTEVSKEFESMGIEMLIPILMAGAIMKSPKIQLAMILASSSISPVPQAAADLPEPAHLSKGMKSRLNHKATSTRYAQESRWRP